MSESVESKDVGVLSDCSNRKNLLVTFGGINQQATKPVFEFFNTLRDVDCDKVFIRDINQAWYHKGIDSDIYNMDKIVVYLQDLINVGKYEKVCFMGNSMGGYAAILFGTLVGVDTVISFAPQTFIDSKNRLLNRDHRWRSQMRNIYAFDGKREEFFNLKLYLKKNNRNKTQIDVYFNPDHRLDRVHAERIKKNKNVKLISVDHGGHGIAKTLRDTGELKILIAAVFEN